MRWLLTVITPAGSAAIWLLAARLLYGPVARHDCSSSASYTLMVVLGLGSAGLVVWVGRRRPQQWITVALGFLVLLATFAVILALSFVFANARGCFS